MGLDEFPFDERGWESAQSEFGSILGVVLLLHHLQSSLFMLRLSLAEAGALPLLLVFVGMLGVLSVNTGQATIVSFFRAVAFLLLVFAKPQLSPTLQFSRHRLVKGVIARLSR